MLTYADLTGSAERRCPACPDRADDRRDGHATCSAAGHTAARDPAAPAPPAFDTAAVRELLIAAFSDQELTNLCFDHFTEVYQDFGSGISPSEKSRRIIEYCNRRGEMERLLALVKQKNAYQYGRFEARLADSNAIAGTRPAAGRPAPQPLLRRGDRGRQGAFRRPAGRVAPPARSADRRFCRAGRPAQDRHEFAVAAACPHLARQGDRPDQLARIGGQGRFLRSTRRGI